MKLNKRLTIIVAAAVLAGIFIGRGCASRETSHAGHPQAGPDKAIVKFWTCSMHPEIKLPDPGKCPKCGMDLIPVMASDEGESLGLRELKLSASAQELAEIETALVERRFVTKEVYLVGKIDYDEARLATLSAWVPGRLDRLFVDYTGVEVKKGDHMISIYSPELLGAQEELIQAIGIVQKLQDSDNSLIKDSSADNVVSSREKLRLWGLNDEQISEIAKRGTAEDHLTIYSPISGIVIKKNAREGDYVETGSPIYTIADLS
ncbi:MAG: efflux RND transporter periplasmic adaptor subunit, partial [Verrucomicrobia bacterium]|nr:efflux RND transporter periplasmic adaptor subunit [Verrucomicrobiota bacterium]